MATDKEAVLLKLMKKKKQKKNQKSMTTTLFKLIKENKELQQQITQLRSQVQTCVCPWDEWGNPSPVFTCDMHGSKAEDLPLEMIDDG